MADGDGTVKSLEEIAALATGPERGLHIFAPLVKVDAQEDGSVIVEGIATAEVVDVDGELVTQAASLAAFRECADIFSEMSDGQSLGPVGEMHQKGGSGKLLAWWPTTAEHEGLTVPAIGVRSKICDPVAVTKCRERVYNGFSIYAPAKTVRRELRKSAEGRPITAVVAYGLEELVLCDKPACPPALFSLVKRAKPAEPEPGDLAKNAAALASKTEEALSRVKSLIAELALLEGDPATWDLHQLVGVLESLTGMKYTAQAIAAKETQDGVAAAADIEKKAIHPAGEDVGGALLKVHAALTAQGDLVKALGVDLTKAAVKAAVEAADGKLADLQKAAKHHAEEQGALKKRLEVVESTEAKIGTDVLEPEKVVGLAPPAAGGTVNPDPIKVLAAAGITEPTRVRVILAAAEAPGVGGR